MVVMTSCGKDGGFGQDQSRMVSLSPTQDTRVLMRAAAKAVEVLFREGARYSRAGVVLMDVKPVLAHTPSLLPLASGSGENPGLMAAMDELNGRFGDETVRFGSRSSEQPWVCMPKNRSKRYTTHVDELMCVGE